MFEIMYFWANLHFSMKILSYNVNGIRAAISKGFLDWLQAANPDIICLQEIKATESQIPTLEIAAAGYPFNIISLHKKKDTAVWQFFQRPNLKMLFLVQEFPLWMMKEETFGRISKTFP